MRRLTQRPSDPAYHVEDCRILSEAGESVNFREKIISGIVFSGRGCARENSPGIYTRVTPILSWIKSHM